MRFSRNVFLRFFILFFFAVIFCMPAISQESEEDTGWFWGKKISNITFEGLKTVKKSELTGITSKYIGLQLSEEIYTDVIDSLYALDFFDEIIPFAKKDQRTADQVLLVFQVSEKPVVQSINFSGNVKLRNGELRDVVTLKTGDVFVESKVLIDERSLRDLYLKKGYTEATVSHRIEESEEGTKVVFIINEGANTVISSIKFTGNTIASERTLKSKMTLKEVGFLKDGAFQQSTLEVDKQAILLYYNDRGYADARILDVLTETNFNEEKGRTELTLTFNIQEGPRYTYNGTTINGNEIFTDEQLLSFIKIKEGDIFNQTKYQEGLQGITNIYAENGYMTNQYMPSINKDAERRTVSFSLDIEERPRSHIENIIIKGNTKTKEHIIRREIPLESGDVFSRDKVMLGLRNLYNLQYFSNVIPEPMPGSEENLVDLVFSVEEQSTTTLEFGMTFSGVSDPDEFPISLFARWQNSNLLGEGRSISIGTNLSNTAQSVTASYGQNWLFNLPIAMSHSLSFSHSKDSALRMVMLDDGILSRNNYYMQYDSFTVSLGSSVGYRWLPSFAIISVAGGISTSINTNVYKENFFIPSDSSINQNANRAGISNAIWASVSLDNRDINYDPSKGWFFSERLGWYGVIPGLEKEFFLKSDTKLEGYFTLFNIPVTERWSFKAILAGYTGFTALFPVPGTLLGDSSRLYIDGMFTGRGWTNIYNTVRGRSMFVNTLELRFPVFPNILGIDGFFDAVAIKSDVKSMFTNLTKEDWYFSFGPGLRFLLPQFPLRLMYAWTFKYDNARGWHFNNPNGEFVLSFNITNK